MDMKYEHEVKHKKRLNKMSNYVLLKSSHTSERHIPSQIQQSLPISVCGGKKKGSQALWGTLPQRVFSGESESTD